MIRLGSLFDGIGGFPLAAVRNGITPVWASEIESFPMAVTALRFPDMLQLGDITKIHGADIEPVDAVTFGSPCQDLSVAGKGKGLDGERSGLFRHAVRVISEMLVATNGQCPRFVVWENVPGALSSNKGKDFREVIESLCGLAEKSRKIPMPRSGKWTKSGMVTGEGYSVAWRVLDAQYWGVAQRRCRIYALVDLGGQCAGKILFEREGLRWHPQTGKREWETASRNATDCVRTYCVQRSDEYKESCVSSTISRRDYKSATDLIYCVDCRNLTENAELSGTLQAKETGGYSLNYQNPVRVGYKFRRLTPLECERLQGYPDGWTDIEGASDTARYKALGNSVAIPCVEFVIGGIAEVLRRSER